MKTNILFHIGSLKAGGAEKSLVSLLNVLPKDLYDIDLLVYEKKGLFYSLLPKEVNVIEMPMPLKCLYVSPKDIKFYANYSPWVFMRKVWGTLKAKVDRKSYAIEQTLWNVWKDEVPVFNKKYDVAVSYLEGFTNYYVIDKIQATKKFLWIHSEYGKLHYNREYDLNFFSKATAVVTISELCKQNLEQNFPQLKNHFQVLENISDPHLIRKMAKDPIESDVFSGAKTLKLVSVGRLSQPKNYKLTIDSALILKKKRIDFEWIVIGEGPLRNELESYRDSKELQNEIKFIGLRANPYAYMDKADIFVQSSLFEGKSIAIDEAKILCKPTVCTNYESVFDTIEHGITGIITEMTPESLAAGICQLAMDKDLRNLIVDNLAKRNFDNLKEVSSYISLFSI